MKRFVGIALVFVLTASAAVAHDHRAPRATLRIGGETRPGWLYHADGWSQATEEPGICEATFATGFAKFRKPLRHSAGDEIVVRFHKAAPPLEVEVHRWPGVDDHGYAAGTPTALPWLLRPHVVEGAVRNWEVVVLPPVVAGHLYLGVGAYWGDEDGCGQQPDLGSQYAAWTFHAVGR